MLTAGDYRTKFIYLYGFIYSGLVALLLQILNKASYCDLYSDKVAFILGFAGLIILFLDEKLKISAITIFILSYILVRGLILSTLATIHSYSVLNYLFPLKNWVALLLFFIIGQSLDLSRKKINDMLLNIFVVSSIFIILLQIYSLMFNKDFAALDSSRLPFIKYRIGMDILLLVYAFIISTMRFLRGNITSKYYYGLVTLVMAVFVSSQTKQIALSIVAVMFYVVFAKGNFVPERKKSIKILGLAIMVILLLFVSTIHSNPFGDSYFSFLKRVELIEYIRGKVVEYPIVGYPIPSNIAHGIIPTEIKNTFFVGDRADLIYPSDLPLLAVILEEGILGLIFIISLLYWCYKKNTDVKYVILLVCATFLTFRMYYMVTLGSTLTYFLLGFYTRDSQSGQEI